MTRGHYVCYAFGEKGVTEYNDKVVQVVPYENVSEKLSTGGYLFFHKKTEASEKTDTENDQVSKQQTDKQYWARDNFYWRNMFKFVAFYPT